MKRATALMLALVLVLAACGDDDAGGSDGGQSGDTNSEVVDELTQEILGDTGSDVPFTDEQAACFAVGLVDEFGADAMVDAIQLEFEDFMAGASAEERLTVVDTMFECIDFAAVMAAEFQGAIGDDSAACLSEAFVGSDGFRTAMANSFGDPTADPFEDPALLEDMLPAMLECLSPEELAQLGGAGG